MSEFKVPTTLEEANQLGKQLEALVEKHLDAIVDELVDDEGNHDPVRRDITMMLASTKSASLFLTDVLKSGQPNWLEDTLRTWCSMIASAVNQRGGLDVIVEMRIREKNDTK